MNSHEEKEWWLDTWWPVLVIGFGITCVGILIHWQPAY